MASRFHRRPATYRPNIIELSEEEKPTQREFNDRHIAQAINYIAADGGDDSPALFVDRVYRIDEALLRPLQQTRGDFDQNLYNQVSEMVLGVQLGYEDAKETISTPIENSDDAVQEDHTPSPMTPTLYRGADEAEAPQPEPSSAPLRARRGGSKDNVQREREFKYGGPGNEIEKWRKDYPPSLPFPETLQMAHWESLKINYDLSRSAKGADTRNFETNVPFHHPQLDQYKNLPPYDSGSRFKLPVPTPFYEGQIIELGSVQKLRMVVHAITKGDRDEEIAKDYAPRLFLEKFGVGRQGRSWLAPEILRC